MAPCYCLIPDVSGDRILAIPASAGGWTLPAVENDDDWFAYASVAVARGASARYGISMTALHERSAPGCRVCELEIQAEQWTPPSGTRWITRCALPALEPAALSAILDAWFAERESGAIPSLRPPWERRGWHADAVRWIWAQCARLGYVPKRPVEQVKAVWSLSTILKVDTRDGALYFKADFAKPPSEPAVIAALARRWPHNVPSVVAADPERGWMLMRDFGERRLDKEPIEHWLEANRSFAAIQAACAADLEPWWQMGCPDLRTPALVRHMDRMLGDPAALRIGEPGGLTETEAARLRELTPRLHAMWGALAAIPVPATLVQQDFRHNNLALSGGSYIFYDWSDCVIGHPFFACSRFLDYLPADPSQGLVREERRRRIADAYLEPWTQLLGQAGPGQAFALTQRLNPLYVAIRRYLDAPYCEPDSFWGRATREGPAIELRRLLAGMAE